MDKQTDFEIKDGELVKYHGNGGDIVIPNGVTNIGNHAFQDCTTITSVAFPENMECYDDDYLAGYSSGIGGWAFSGCTGLKSITIPAGIHFIGNDAFKGCTSLTDVTILEGKIRIGEGVFEDCTSLEHISFPKVMSGVKIKFHYHTSHCIIRARTFKGCTSLKSVVLPKAVTEITASSFEGCTALTEFEASVEKIPAGAFQNCTNLKKLTLHYTAVHIESDAFSGCTNLTDVTFTTRKKVDQRRKDSFGIHSPHIDGGAFRGCTNLTEFTLPKKYRGSLKVHDGVLYEVYKVWDGESIITLTLICCPPTKTKVQILDDTDRIGENAFWGCDNLTEIVLPENVGRIWDSAFAHCDTLTKIVLPSNLKTIPANAFRDCTVLSEIVLPANVKTIETGAFCNCTALKTLTIPEHIEKIGEGAFAGCENLKITYHGYTFPTTVRENFNLDAIRTMIETKDFSVRMDLSVKYAVIFTMYFATPEDETISAYIKKNFAKMFSYLIDMQNSGAVKKILDTTSLVTKRNIDKFIQYAIDNKKHEIQVILMNHKTEKNWYDDVETTISKKFKL